MLFRALPILLCFFSLSTHAQERLTLQDAIAKALEHNFDIRIADITAQQAGANNTLGNAGLLPSINGSGSVNVGSTNAHSEFVDGRVQEVKGAATFSYNGAVTAGYTLFAGGRAWLIRKQLGINEDLARTQLREQMQLVVSQVIQTYARVVWQQQQGVAIDTALVLAQVRMFLSQVRFETGASAKMDFLQARVDYNARQSDSLQQIAAVIAAFADLNFLMGDDLYKIYDVDDSLQVDLELAPTEKERLKDLNLSIDVARRSAEVSRLDVSIARTYMLPTVGATAGYNYNYSKSQAGLSLFNRSSGPVGGLNLNVPIFQGGNLRRQVRVASLQAFRDELLYARQNTEIGRQYRSAWKNYEMSVAAYKLEQENIRYAKENLDIQKARFRVGIATTLETREAESSYVLALNRLYTAAYNLKVSETRVLELESGLVQ